MLTNHRDPYDGSIQWTGDDEVTIDVRFDVMIQAAPNGELTVLADKAERERWVEQIKETAILKAIKSA